MEKDDEKKNIDALPFFKTLSVNETMLCKRKRLSCID
jgi:hypothetical protein